MIKLVLDAVVLMAVVYALLGEDAPDFSHVFLVSLGLTVANFGCATVFEFLGVFVTIPIVLVDGFILMYFCSLPLSRAIIALVVLLVYNLVFLAVWSYLL